MSQTISATNPLGTEKIGKLMVRYAVPTITFLRQIVLFVPTMLLLSLSGDVLKVLWTGPISDGGSCVISVIVLIVCWKGIFKKEDLKV